MTITEKWNAIVSDIQKNQSLKEDAVQRLWEDIFADADVFGYSKRSKEIDIWRNIQIGSRKSTIPDIIIRDSIKNKDLFVVELKQLNFPFNQTYKDQLLSYMRLLELKVGILICNKIYIYFRDNSTTEYSIEIPFEKNNAYGEKFIELFSKGDFDNTNVKDFLIEVENTKTNISVIISDIQKLKLEDLLIEHYAGKYTNEEIKTALNQLNITISIGNEPKTQDPQPPTQPTGSDGTGGIGKSTAISFLENLGYSLTYNLTTYASKNKSSNDYWANPNINLLLKDWYIILDDWNNRILYLLFIPHDSIALSQLATRRDNKNKIDLQIIYNDSSFKDKRSGLRFKPYLQKKFKY
ncbi:MAG: GxxExxY protein [Clostridiales bacterium]|nr:GxxExxY protein [Clostridiales bacterium]